MEPTQRTDFALFIEDKIEEIKKLFTRKNEGYGANGDLFWNFRRTAKRIYPDKYTQDPYDAMFLVAETLVDKHNVALAKGITVSECEERLLDRIIYSLLQLKMVYDRSEHREYGEK
ncbi:MAG: hypothetical protein N2Z22_07880 [Turneriella sp.]|nr:hypothetical protein [Turneriella sp.]